MRTYLSHIVRFLPLVPFVLVTVGFFFVSPEAIVALLGTGNAYVFMCVVAFLGGVSTFGSVPNSAVLITLAAGGLNPLLLALLAAVAVTLGDTVTYALGYYGRVLLGPRLAGALEWLTDMEAKHPRLTPLFIFCYAAFVPLSNDVVTIPMGASRYPLWKVMVPLLIGTAIFNTALAYASVYLYDSVKFLL